VGGVAQARTLRRRIGHSVGARGFVPLRWMDQRGGRARRHGSRWRRAADERDEWGRR